MQTQSFMYTYTYSKYAASLTAVLKGLIQNTFHSRKYDSQCWCSQYWVQVSGLSYLCIFSYRLGSV